MSTATTTFINAVIPAGDNTALTTAISDATALLGSKIVGEAVGNVSQSTHEAYNTAIVNATIVREASATQAELDAAVDALSTATTTFTNAVIPAGNKIAITTAISEATTLLGSKPVGTAVGNVSQSAHDAYYNAIAYATIVKNANVTQAELDAAGSALSTATTTFYNAVIPAGNNTALTTAITNATTLLGSKTVGTAAGNVSQAAYNVYYTAIANATIVKDASATQAELDAAVSALSTATTTFTNAVIPAGNNSTLTTAITDATTLLGSKTVGEAVGNVSQSAYDAYNTAIANATEVKDASATQAEIDTAVSVLSSATTTFYYAIYQSTDKIELIAALDDATNLLRNTPIGIEIGNVTPAVHDAYQEAIASATNVTLATDATQAQVDETVITLSTSTTTFYNNIIKERTVDGWSYTGLWQSLDNNSGIINKAVGLYVSLPYGDNSGGLLPNAPSGRSFWFGRTTSNNGNDMVIGNYLNDQIVYDAVYAGGTSKSASSGRLTSAVFSVPTTMEDKVPVITFQSWWEIESNLPSRYDLMKVYVVSDDSVPVQISILNPTFNPQTNAVPFTSGGYNQPSIWKQYALDLSEYRGKNIKVIFEFNTGDATRNAFRGWFIDSDVKLKLQTAI